MPRERFDKIIATGPDADQKSIEQYLNKTAKDIDDHHYSRDDECTPYKNKCEFAISWIDSFKTEISLFPSVDHVITESPFDMLEADVNAILHSTQCERCNWALMDLLNHLDENGNYKD